MAFENLPGVFSNKIDGNLVQATQSRDPVVLILGTAGRGDTETLYTVQSVSNASSEFGRADGTLIRGLYEVVAGGSENIRLMRIAATAASLSNIGGGITIQTVSKDAGAGSEYKIFWEDTAGRLRIWRTSDDLLVYDNYPTYPAAAVDENELSVSGSSAAPGAGDIGTLVAPLTLSQSNGVSGAVYTAGSDGITLSLMEKYQALFSAYKLLENEDLDHIIPMDVYLDDLSVGDMTTAEVSALNVSAPWAADAQGYPEPGSTKDALGKLFAQEYSGEWYFWWDMDNDGIAEIYPSVGSATGSLDAYGTALESADFHEVNFAYQLADFCYRQSEDNAEMIGFIGVKPPNSWSLKDVSAWIGRAPTYVESGSNLVVSTNGSGLLGNRWLAGRIAVGGTGLPGHTVDGISGLAYGGFIATDSGWIDGSQVKDRNDHLVDIGKYISVVGAQAILANSSSSTAYVATGAAVYGGFVTSLPSNSAPTNKIVPGVRLPFRISLAKLDDLAGSRLVMFQEKSKGYIVADAPTASRPDSDYNRLSTVRIVKDCIDVIRSVSDPFIGEGITGAKLAALDTAIERGLVKLQKAGYIQRFEHDVTATASERVQGKANVELILVPAFELRQLTIWVSLAAQ